MGLILLRTGLPQTAYQKKVGWGSTDKGLDRDTGLPMLTKSDQDNTVITNGSMV